MRPQDIAILLKIVSLNTSNWQLVGLSSELHISISEISESLNRSKIANLLDANKKEVNRLNLLEFLEYGIKYVFPQQPGMMLRGIPTAHSHPFMKDIFISELNYVWPDNNGKVMGLMIEPFYINQVKAINDDQNFYKMLALVDVIRVGKVREVKIAVKELKRIITNE